MFFISILWESAAQALGQLMGNKLRSLLSLLGITIGIWCIIAVLSAIDSLESNIRNSFQKLGNDVVYVSKQPWGEDPEENYWKYLRRPQPTYQDFEAIESRVQTAGLCSFTLFMGFKTLENREVNVQNVFLVGSSYNYAELFKMEFAKGRYFTPAEHSMGADQVLLGFETANNLFPSGINPVGYKVKLGGRNMTVVGVIKKSGKDLINPFNFDNAAIIPYKAARKFVNLASQNFGSSLAVKANPGVPFDRLKDDVTAVLRAHRRLSPLEKDNFALNSLSVISGLFDSIFSVLRSVGLFIGLFSIIVGVFSVANIMFVSVKERTGQIGVKKALGAKSYVILIEFLIEAVVLCTIGGILGLILVWLATLAASAGAGFEIFLSQKNALIGLTIAIITGVVAGVIPAWQASRMDPVEAIRS